MLFILLYYIASTVNYVSATVRYQIIIYPLAMILSALGIKSLINNEVIKKLILPGYIYLAIMIISLFSLNSIRPFYFSYASDLLPKKYVLNFKDMGDGSYEAAQYLNSLPNAKNLIVWSDKRGVCNFFAGKCFSGMGFTQAEIEFDYFVVSSGRENRTTTMTLNRYNGGNTALIRLDKLYNIDQADFYLKIDNRPDNFDKVIKAAKLSDEK